MGGEERTVKKVLQNIFSLGSKFVPLILIGIVALMWFVDSAMAAECKTMEEYQEEYQECYACLTIKVMLDTFMQVASQTYGVSQLGGVVLLKIGAFLWVAFWVIKKISSFTNPEAPTMMNDFLIFMFKFLVAYVGIKAGVTVLVDYFINPILSAGADLGTAYLSFGLPTLNEVEGMTYKYKYEGPTDVLDPMVMNKILAFTEGVSIRVSNNMVIGNALMCNSLDAFRVWGFRIIHLWLWFCGAFIWVVGFLLTIFVCYYLLDIAFKIGVAIILLPIAIGLWPFNPTKGRVKACFSIILRSAAIYALLAICTTLSTILVDSALDKQQLFKYFEEDNVTAVKEMFSLTGTPFLVLCIAFLYSIKIIGKNETLASKLFPDEIFNTVAPIHGKFKAVTDLAHDKVMKPVTLVRDIATHQTGRAIRGGIGATKKGVAKVGKATGNMAANAYKGFIGKK